jgi:hypothetical protein
MFGCKNQLLPSKTGISAFELINNKKQDPENISNSIHKNFDFSRRFSEKEVSVLKLDTSQIESNEYYFLTDQKFLKEEIKGISFLIYYKHKYGDQLEKILRIKKKGLFTDITLSMTGGDGQDTYRLSSEFVNDSIFVKTYIHKITAIDNNHLMAYSTDSIVTSYKYDSKFNFTEINQESLNIYEECPTYYKELKGKTFKTWSSPFTINDLKYRWEYEVKYTDETDEESAELVVSIISQKLINMETRTSVLDLDSPEFFAAPKNISKLENHIYPLFQNDLIDVNKDDYVDIQIVTEIAGGGANTSYASFLFDPTKKIFEYTPLFSGENIHYDLSKNRIAAFMKSSVMDYYYKYINLKPNRKEIDFVENVHHYEDTIFYEKVVNGKVIRKKKFTVSEYENVEQFLERK